MIKYVAAVSVAGLIGWGFAPSQSAPCDPKAPKSDEQVARRRTAIGVARQINTAEAAQYPATRRYATLADLTAVKVPAGFDVQVATDGTSYTFSVKDKQDACGAAVFSDQEGVIYNASPLQ